MTEHEKKAYFYWQYLSVVQMVERLWRNGSMDSKTLEWTLADVKKDCGLEESIEQLMDHVYLDHIIEQYGTNMKNSPIPLFQGMIKAKSDANVDPLYKSFTEIVVKSKVDISSSYALQCWLRSRNTIALLALWEKKHNPSFHHGQAELLQVESANSTSPLTLKQWIARTGAKGIVALQGRYGGTYAHPIIALDFESWLSVENRYQILGWYCSDRKNQ